MYVLHPIYMVFDAIMNFKMEQTKKLLGKLTTTTGKMVKDVPKTEERELKSKPLMKCVIMNWLPAGDAVFQIITSSIYPFPSLPRSTGLSCSTRDPTTTLPAWASKTVTPSPH